MAQQKPMTGTEIMARLEALEAENSRLKAQASSQSRITFKVSEKGAVSVYGLGRFPVTLYGEQWGRLLAEAPKLAEFITANASQLSTKDNPKEAGTRVDLSNTAKA